MYKKDIKPLDDSITRSIGESIDRLEHISESGQPPVTFMGDTFRKYKAFSDASAAKEFAKKNKNHSIIGKKNGRVYVGIFEDAEPITEGALDRIKKFMDKLSGPEIVGPTEKKVVDNIKSLPKKDLKAIVGDDTPTTIKKKLRDGKLTRKQHVFWKAAYDTLNEAVDLGIIESVDMLEEENKDSLEKKLAEYEKKYKEAKTKGGHGTKTISASTAIYRDKIRQIRHKLSQMSESVELEEKDNQGTKQKYVDKASKTKTDDGEGLDPVGKGDADIDNDGDTDKTDEYLHARRKAIAKTMKKRKVQKEELEQVDEAKKNRAKTKPTGFRTGDKVKMGDDTVYIRSVNKEDGTAVVDLGGGKRETVGFEELTLMKTAGGKKV